MSRRVMKCRTMDEKYVAERTGQEMPPALQAIVSLVASGNIERAMAEAGGIADSVVATEAWRLLSEINANLQRWDDAVSAIENALHHQPGSRPLRLARALLLEQR